MNNAARNALAIPGAIEAVEAFSLSTIGEWDQNQLYARDLLEELGFFDLIEASATILAYLKNPKNSVSAEELSDVKEKAITYTDRARSIVAGLGFERCATLMIQRMEGIEDEITSHSIGQ